MFQKKDGYFEFSKCFGRIRYQRKLPNIYFLNYFHSNWLIIITCINIYINEFRYSLRTTECGHFAGETFITFASKNIKTIERFVYYDVITPAHIENINFSYSEIPLSDWQTSSLFKIILWYNQCFLLIRSI